MKSARPKTKDVVIAYKTTVEIHEENQKFSFDPITTMRFTEKQQPDDEKAPTGPRISVLQYKQAMIGAINSQISSYSGTGARPADILSLAECKDMVLLDESERVLDDEEILMPGAATHLRLERNMQALAENHTRNDKETIIVVAVDRGATLDFTTKVFPAGNSPQHQQDFANAQSLDAYDYFQKLDPELKLNNVTLQTYQIQPEPPEYETSLEFVETNSTLAYNTLSERTAAASHLMRLLMTALIGRGLSERDALSRIEKYKKSKQLQSDDFKLAEPRTEGLIYSVSVLPNGPEYVRNARRLADGGVLFLSHSADTVDCTGLVYGQEFYYQKINEEVTRWNAEHPEEKQLPECPSPLFYCESIDAYNKHPIITKASILVPHERKSETGKVVYCYPNYFKNLFNGKQELRFSLIRQLNERNPNVNVEMYAVDDVKKIGNAVLSESASTVNGVIHFCHVFQMEEKTYGPAEVLHHIYTTLSAQGKLRPSNTVQQIILAEEERRAALKSVAVFSEALQAQMKEKYRQLDPTNMCCSCLCLPFFGQARARERQLLGELLKLQYRISESDFQKMLGNKKLSKDVNNIVLAIREEFGFENSSANEHGVGLRSRLLSSATQRSA